MLETICPNCKQRYPLGTDHACPAKSAPKKPAAFPSSSGSGSPYGSEKTGQADASSNLAGMLSKKSRQAIADAASDANAFGIGWTRTTVDGVEHIDPKRGPGRPKTITDMKAYRLQKQRERRARLKAEKAPK